jgi:hypothetical protein
MAIWSTPYPRCAGHLLVLQNDRFIAAGHLIKILVVERANDPMLHRRSMVQLLVVLAHDRLPLLRHGTPSAIATVEQLYAKAAQGGM